MPWRSGASSLRTRAKVLGEGGIKAPATSFRSQPRGSLRALAVTTTTRSQALPDVPVLSETLPGYEASGWYGIGAPRGTPAETIGRLNSEVNASAADAQFKARFTNLGGTVSTGTPADLAKLIADETAKWGKVIRIAGIRTD